MTAEAETAASADATAPPHPLREFWSYFSVNSGAVAGLAVISAVALLAALAGLLAPHAPSHGAAPSEEMVVRHAIEIGARLGDRADPLLQQLEMNFLENVLGLVRGRAAQREIARQCGAALGEGPHQTATGETLPIALILRHAAVLALEPATNNPVPRA